MWKVINHLPVFNKVQYYSVLCFGGMLPIELPHNLVKLIRQVISPFSVYKILSFMNSWTTGRIGIKFSMLHKMGKNKSVGGNMQFLCQA